MSILVCYTHQKTFPETQGHMTMSHRSSAKTKTTTEHFLSHVSNPGMEHIELKRGGLLTTCKNIVTLMKDNLTMDVNLDGKRPEWLDISQWYHKLV